MPIGLGTVYVRALVPCTHIIASVEIENRKKMSPLAQFIIILDFLERIVFFFHFLCYLLHLSMLVSCLYTSCFHKFPYMFTILIESSRYIFFPAS